MGEHVAGTRLGEYAITRELPPSGVGRRLLALDPDGRSAKVLHVFAIRPDDVLIGTLRRAMQSLSSIRNRHVLPVERLVVGLVHQPFAVTPYTGHQDGLVDLGCLLREKGGQMEPVEADRLLRQLFEGLGAAHEKLVHHGVLRPRDVLVDRHGSAAIEMLGVARTLEGMRGFSTEVQRDEVRGVVELGFRALTGHDANTVGLPASKLVRRLDPAWDAFFAHGLDPIDGFDNAQQAVAALPSSGFDRLPAAARAQRARLLTGLRRQPTDRG